MIKTLLNVFRRHPRQDNQVDEHMDEIDRYADHLRDQKNRNTEIRIERMMQNLRREGIGA